jgi:hypothetical protein
MRKLSLFLGCLSAATVVTVTGKAPAAAARALNRDPVEEPCHCVFIRSNGAELRWCPVAGRRD